jgi:arylsulfatase
LDWSTGEILNGLKKRGLERNTLVLFSSDNGPWYQGSPGRLRGRKGTTYEGGTRVPMLARMPARIAAGGVSGALTSTMDFFPTVASLCGANLPDKPLDGVNLWPVLGGKQKEVQRDLLLYFDGWNIQCARRGEWKLHVARWNAGPYDQAPAGGRINLPLPKPELYNLAADPDESYDVAPENPKVVEEILGRLTGLIAGFPAEAQKAWAETRARVNTQTSVGATGRLARP